MRRCASSSVNRREFLKRGAAAAGLGLADTAAGQTRGVAIIMDPKDAVASTPPAKWAAGVLRQTLADRGIPARIVESVAQAGSGDFRMVASCPVSGVPLAPEAFAILPGRVSGCDARGLVYGLLELADTARHASDPLAALQPRQVTIERPANVIRSIARLFESDVEDKQWFHDRSMWREYLSMLAENRFNRFSLTFGLGYNFPRNVTDVYFYFAYPFLLSVPGYKVRANPLPDAERDRNLETLRFIGEETVARGLQFQLGLWTHAYQWVDSPHANYTIEGLSSDNHAPYCRDALQALLKAVPAISGVTFRVHGESGIPEGSYSFWQTVFEGIVRSGRRVEIDMHAKGMDQKTIDIALATGMPVNISPKYWAEHMGLAYHQAAIRELEMPPREKVEGTFALSAGSRRFLRYGYGDLLIEKRKYGVLHRIWPGTQRVLLWGDPALAAGYGRYASFCGSAGVELCEPLTFKGRMGSGVAGGRLSYADASLNTKYDWQKYLYQYRIWGRLTYNPEADPESWRRYLRTQYQAAAQDVEPALANASRILPLITTSHGASGSNNTYWPEIYTNMPIVDESRPHPYRDSPVPRRFGTVSPFDPQLFARIDDFADELLKGQRSGKYSPLDVAAWLDDFANAAAKHLKQAEARLGAKQSSEFRRLAADVAIQSGLGSFFAAKLRAATLWALYRRTGDAAARQEALNAYRAARNAWAALANRAKTVYAADVTYGVSRHLRGHWLDRLPAIDEDIADMEKRAATKSENSERIRAAVREVLARPETTRVASRHTPPAGFRPGEPLEIELSLDKSNGRSVRLHYRRVNQAELWQVQDLNWRDNRYQGVIAADYTRSPYPLQYYFELRDGSGKASLYPGFGPTVSNQPYFVVRGVL
jgi:hypothetical protein